MAVQDDEHLRRRERREVGLGQREAAPDDDAAPRRRGGPAALRPRARRGRREAAHDARHLGPRAPEPGGRDGAPAAGAGHRPVQGAGVRAPRRASVVQGPRQAQVPRGEDLGHDPRHPGEVLRQVQAGPPDGRAPRLPLGPRPRGLCGPGPLGRHRAEAQRPGRGEGGARRAGRPQARRPEVSAGRDREDHGHGGGGVRPHGPGGDHAPDVHDPGQRG
mmetsp:Transcript_63647/g.137875  ORF Transcript_63647/g.137875 Transcript_63647/m.137875 type:complete len:218 (+) Transcript_63647:1198-1851(+)